MIFHTVCTSCGQSFRVNVEPGDVPLVKQLVDEETKTCPCPRLCGGRLPLSSSGGVPEDSRVFRFPVDLTGKDLYRAVNGAGLPDEIPKDRAVIEAMLRAYRVKDVVLEESGNRYFLHAIELDNGTTVHLCAGSRGAQVLKITKEPSHAVAHRD